MPATYVISSDSFTRANQTGWGTASDFEVWSQPVGSGALSIASNRGKVTTNTGSSVMLLGTGTSADLDIRVRFSLSSAANDYAGCVLRYTDANDYLYVRVHNNAINVIKVVGGVSTTIGTSSAVGLSSNTNYWLHASAFDTTSLVNVWPDGQGEPSGWVLTVVDASLVGAGQYGLYAFVNAGADTVLFDSFQALIIPQLMATVGGKPVRLVEDTLQIAYKLDERQRAQFTVVDYTNVFFAQFGEKVVLTDPLLGVIFSGFVLTCTQDKSNTFPNKAIEHQLDCVDNRHLLDKRRSQKLYTNQSSSTIIADLLQRYGAVEKVTSTYAVAWTELQTEWQTGALTNVVSTTNASTGNVGAADLELAPGGTMFTYSGSTSVATNQNALHYTGYASSGYNLAYTYRQFWSGSQTIATNDTFAYDVWISSTSPAIMSGIDFVCSDGTSLTSKALLDGQGLSSAASTDLSGIASDKWYTRTFTLPASLNGKTLVSIQVFFSGTTAGTYDTYFRNVFYNATTIFGTGSTLGTNVQTKNNGYTNIALTQVTAGNKVQAVQLSPGSFGAVGVVQSSLISWTENLPSGCSVLVETSIDSGATYQAATTGSAIPNLLAGMVAGTGANNPSLSFQTTFTLGSDPTAQPSVTDLLITITPSSTSGKVDMTKTWRLNSDFSTGTFTNLMNNTALGIGITLNGFQRTWVATGTYSDQVLWGLNSPSQTLINQQWSITAGFNSDARSQLVAAGQWQNFTAEVDIQVPGNDPVSQGSLVYRTSSGAWQNNNDTYAYAASFSQQAVMLGHGTNSGTGGGSFTVIQAVTISLAANSVHRLKVIVSGNSHQVFLDGVMLINATDSTYGAAGYLGLRTYNHSASTTATATYDSFGICAALSGTWQSAATSISGPGTYGNSLVEWDIDSLPDNTTSISVQTSVDGGSTYQSVANGSPIPNLTAGQALSGTSVILKVTLAANGALVVPQMDAISVWVLGQFASTGSRSTAPLAVDSMVRPNVGSGFGTATNGSLYTQFGTGTTALTSNEATIVNTTGDCQMQLGASYRATVLADAPIRYYRLDDAGTSAIDSGSQAQNGTLHGGVSTGVGGLLANDPDAAMFFDGSTGYVSLPTTGLPTGAAAWTLEAWVQLPEGTSVAFGAFLAMGNRASLALAGLYVNVSGGQIFPYLGVFGSDINSATAMNIGVPYHVVGTYDGTNTRLFVNGTLVAGPHAVTLALVQNFASISSDGTSPIEFFSGTIDEPAIYSTALSAQQILNHYLAGVRALANQADEAGTVRFNLSASTISAGIEEHFRDASHYYRLVASTTALSIVRNAGAGNTTLATASVSLSTGTFYRLRFQVYSSGLPSLSLSGRVWPDGTPEPTSTWNVQITDSPYQATVLADAPLHYYRLDDTGSSAADLGSSVENGTLNGTITKNQPGLLRGDPDTAMAFDGATGYVTLPNAGTWPVGNGAWTLECWCVPKNTTNATNGHMLTIGTTGTNGAVGAIVQTSTGGWGVVTWGGSGHDFLSNGTSIAGTVYYVAATYDGSNLLLYVGSNGTLATYGPFAPGTLALSAVHQSIGQSLGFGNFFAGVIDEVAIYNSKLTITQLTTHYVTGNATGGVALMANGTGTASFDSLAVSAYPDPSFSLAGVGGRPSSSVVNWTANLPTSTSLVSQTSFNGITWNAVSNNGNDIAGITAQFYTTLVEQKLPLAFFQLAELSGITIFDSGPNAYTGTINGGVSFGVDGPLQGPGETNIPALTFNGTSGYLGLPAVLNGNGWGLLTVEGWFKLSTTSLGATTVMLASGTTAAHTGYQLYWSSTTSLNFTVGNGTTSATATFATTPSTSAWLYLAGVYDGSAVRLYVNGVQQATAALSGTVSASLTPVIGASTALASFYPGSIGQVAFYNQALAATDIAAHENAGIVTPLQLYQKMVLAKAPSAYYQLSDQVGTTAIDSGPNAYAGTINGTVLLDQGGALLGSSEVGVTAMAFDGATGYVALPSALSTAGWTQLSVECWVYLPQLPTANNPRLVANCHSDVDNSGGFQLAVAGPSSGGFPYSPTTLSGGAGTVGFSLGTGSSHGNLCSLVPLAPQVWNYLVFTWDGSTISYYCNGALQTSAAFSGVLGTPPGVINIGRNPVYAGDYAQATIGQVAIYNGVLAASDISARYSAAQATASSTILDEFNSNSSANYTQANYGGGANGTWTWDTANSRLVGSGGTNGTLSYNGVVSLDSQVFADIDEADGSGFLANSSLDAAGNRNLYYLQIFDSQAAANQNSVKLFRRFGGAATQLGTTVSISFQRGTYHHFVLDIEAGVLTVTMDGVQILQQTDASPLLAGQNGLLLNSLLRVYTFQLLQYKPSVSGQLYTKQILSSSDPTATPQLLTHVAAAFGSQIDAGVLIPSADYRDSLISTNTDDLAKQSNLSWYVDQNGSVWFKQTGAQASPWILQSASSVQATDIEYDNNLAVLISGDLYRNRQTITNVSNTVTGAFNTFVGDKSRRDFTLTYKVAPGTVPVVRRDGIRQSVGAKGTSGFQWYYKENDATISQDAAQLIVRDTESLSVSYTGYFVSTVTIDNVAAQQALAVLEGGSGIIEQITDGHAIAYSAAVTLAQQLLSFYSVTGRTITFKTYRNGLSVGQILPVFLPEEGIFGSRMYITQINLTMQTQPGNTTLYGYIVQATELPNIKSWQTLLASGLIDTTTGS